MSKFRIGVDIGGTFTDIVFLDEAGQLHTRKVSSSVDNYARAIAEGIAEVFSSTDLEPQDVREVRHGTTVASNAILQLQGARVGLITTRGFRDVLEIRTLRMPRLYDLAWEKPPVLVERYLRQEVTERVAINGDVNTPIDLADAEASIRILIDEGAEAIAVCLINSFVNPSHEQAIKQIIERIAPGMPMSISSEVLPEIREYERTSTTVINAYVLPVVGAYLAALRNDLNAAKVTSPLLLMQSNGGLTTDEVARRLPMHIVESGPAGGVVGAQAVAEKMGLQDLITFDMGGTTAKASLIADGQVSRAQDMQVGGGIMQGSRLLTGGGYALKVPAIDLAEVGAGGGSIIWIDAGGAIQVGPKSAGAVPGPVCYDQGGETATVTDANLLLGYINPERLVGGAVKLNAELARKNFTDTVAKPLGMEAEQAALGAHRIAAATMIRAIKSVSSERGRDPRGYAIFAFGGNGPLFAASMAQEIGISKIIVPPSPGLFSAFGLLYADVEHHYSRTFKGVLTALDADAVDNAWQALAKEADAQLAIDGFNTSARRIERHASLHYKGQTYELTVAAPDGPLGAAGMAELAEAYGQEHERVYGHRAGPEEPVELVSIQIIGRGIPDGARVPDRVDPAEPPEPTSRTRQAYFGTAHGWMETDILTRPELSDPRAGPCIIEEYDATCLVPPGARAALDSQGNIVITFVDAG